LAGRGRMRASRADREQVIELLKAAFAQDRLTKDELDLRVGQALVSRTHADLAALTADLPTGPSAVEPVAAGPLRTPARTLAIAARRAGICILSALALVGVAALTHAEILAIAAFFSAVAAIIAASAFWVTGLTPGRSGVPGSCRRGRIG